MNHPWDFIRAAYIISGIGLVGLVVAVIWRLRTWSARARDLERP